MLTSCADDSSLEIKYENLYPLRDDDDDLKRRLKFTIGSYTKIKIKIYRRLLFSVIGDVFQRAAAEILGQLREHEYYYMGELFFLVRIGIANPI